MNVWLLFATVLLSGLIPCGIVCLRDGTMQRFVALQVAQVMVILVMLLLAEGFHREICLDMALVMAVLALASGLVFARFLERLRRFIYGVCPVCVRCVSGECPAYLP